MGKVATESSKEQSLKLLECQLLNLLTARNYLIRDLYKYLINRS